MAVRLIASWLACVCLVALVTDATAQQGKIRVDGCARLARAVYDEVSGFTSGSVFQSGPWRIDNGTAEVAICRHAAKTVSRAFGAAMAAAGIEVQWGQGSGPVSSTARICNAGYLYHCYPKTYFSSPTAPGSDAALVRIAWQRVSSVIMEDMYNPRSSDEVRFRDNDLKLRLGLSLRMARFQIGR